MFFNKTALITTLSLFLCSACASLSDNKAQQMQISNLQTELMQVQEELVKIQETKQQTETILANVKNSLISCQKQVDELTALLDASKKTASKTCKAAAKLHDKTILGETEWVYVTAAKSNYRARIDTGAATSSINAADIERFERDGKKWVRFYLSHDNSPETQLIEARIRRIVKIAQSTNSEEETERRFVVKLHVIIGDISHQTEFTLTDRSHMEYDILIGRSFLQDVALVDVSQEYIHPKYKAK
jgi:hypothetical protein